MPADALPVNTLLATAAPRRSDVREGAPVSSSASRLPAALAVDAPRLLLLLLHPCAQGQRIDNGATPLHQACFRGHLRIAQCLVACGASLTILDAYQMTPLAVAINQNRNSIMQWETFIKHPKWSVRTAWWPAPLPLEPHCPPSPSS